MRRVYFQRSWLPTLAALAAIALTLALGNWQLNRGNAKAALAERISAANHGAAITLAAPEVKADEVIYRRMEAQGRFEPKYAVLIDNRVLHGVVGYDVVMPLQIDDSGRYVLVNRGWVAATPTRSTLPSIATPTQPVHIVGLATVPSGRYFELSPDVTQGQVWENLTLERYRAAFPLALQPIVIQQENDIGDGLERTWKAPDLGIQMHYGYAFQWFAMAAAIAVLYGVLSVRKRVRQQG